MNWEEMVKKTITNLNNVQRESLVGGMKISEANLKHKFYEINKNIKEEKQKSVGFRDEFLESVKCTMKSSQEQNS